MQSLPRIAALPSSRVIVELPEGSVVVRPTGLWHAFLLENAELAAFEEWTTWTVGRMVLVVLALVGLAAAIVFSVPLHREFSFPLALAVFFVTWVCCQGLMTHSFRRKFPRARELTPVDSRFAVAAQLGRGGALLGAAVLAMVLGMGIVLRAWRHWDGGIVLILYFSVVYGGSIWIRLWSRMETGEWASLDKLRSRLALRIAAATPTAFAYTQNPGS